MSGTDGAVGTALFGKETTLIGRGTVLDGTFELEHDLRVEGVLRGAWLSTRGSLIVAAGGEVHSQRIEVGSVVIRGTVVGALRARQQVHMEAGGRFRGQLETPRLVLEVGAELVEGGVEVRGAGAA